jgi:predicted ferric reductase
MCHALTHRKAPSRMIRHMVCIMPAALVAALLAACILAPMLLGWALVGWARPWWDEVAGALGLIGCAAMLTNGQLSGRFRYLSGALGVDRTLRWHQILGTIAAIAVLLLHPFLYSESYGPAFLRPDDPTHASALGLGPWSITTGMLAWVLFGLLTLTALRRTDTRWRYETWRGRHGLFAGLLAALALHHALVAGRYAANPAVAGMLVMLTLPVFVTLLDSWLLRPLRLSRRPWTIAGIRPAAEGCWEISLEPVGHPGLAYAPGQFAWVKLACGPFSRVEHPFSFTSAPADGARLRFTIKQSGDFTDHIGELAVGTPAWVDGPHGHLDRAIDGAPGLVFLTGGVGVAPAISMIRALAPQAAPPMLLLYGTRNAPQLIARAELEQWAARGRLDLTMVLAEPPAGWAGETGMLDAARIARHCAPAADAGWVFVLCGPPPMLHAAEAALRQLNVPRHRILAERFTFD